MNTTTATPYTTDKHGFPAVNCPRCAGTGSIAAYHNHFHGRCFKCGGAGTIPATRGIANTITALADQLRRVDTDPAARAEIDQSAEKARASYEQTLRKRAGRPNRLDADTNRLVTAARAILTSNLDDHDKAINLGALYRQRRTTTNSRGVRDRMKAIHYAGGLLDNTPLVERLAEIASYLDTLTA